MGPGRDKAELVVDHRHDVRALGHLDHILGLGDRPGHRLLAEDMLARPERGHDHAVVKVRRRRDDHRVDVGPLDQFAVVCGGQGRAEGLRRAVGPLGPA